MDTEGNTKDQQKFLSIAPDTLKFTTICFDQCELYANKKSNTLTDKEKDCLAKCLYSILMI